jgi:AcrR family transcriptional regulator
VAEKKKQHGSPVPITTRKPRADAERNRLRILEVAKDSFTRFGADASMDEIGRTAGVGAGTLYRHFPTRDALIEAVYRSEVEKLAAAQRKFAETMPPVDALRAWMLLFIDHIAGKYIIAPVLNSMSGGPTRMFEGAHGAIYGAIEDLVRRGVNSGELRDDVQAYDLLQALIGVAHSGPRPGWLESARRLVEILIAGARAGG